MDDAHQRAALWSRGVVVRFGGFRSSHFAILGIAKCAASFVLACERSPSERLLQNQQTSVNAKEC
jgi:hypothetical protein